ncbi:Na/Pi cotransporter family protein [Rhizobium leguminosarum]|uniref:Na/Pi cotransporter family protein n=1 Tax=Rhizobium TaxID=379 RepID=UPI00102F907B|nr:Na/Pi cotransporter family protein [Rhizobium leguminosarum]TBF87419.1 Na/Pi cotransporter family protein [Rhizobium leguminosarum]TBG07034.1 Na/Pi cotransporter family protein [Rhizobium leguminosarum]TBG07816.1 Na/Pi cotransporter family protein [Rhizobium leguminosarum]TBG30725.1 Na/Pi cotransporter family protein [Rhizobium leguminosarum]TBG50115.1 Na/Pi cotransporter family protein [Rhizobium leguminosarum]
MASTIVMLNLFGSVALMLFGLTLVKESFLRSLGTKLTSGLAAGTSNGARSFLSGCCATIALQSSTATAMIVSSFVDKRLVEPRMAQIVLLGANIGTAITASMVAAGTEWLSPLLIFSGVALGRCRASSRKSCGTILIGVGLMLLALQHLGAATLPMQNSQTLLAFITLLDNAWPLAVIVSACIAFVSASSLAAIMLVLSFCATRALSADLTVLLVLGANVGSAFLPVLTSAGASTAYRRTLLGNLLVRAAGCAVGIPSVSIAADLLRALPLDPAYYAIDIHLAFNIALAILAWPLTALISRLTLRLIPASAGADPTTYLQDEALANPPVALANATRETLCVGDIVEQMLTHIRKAFETNDPSELDQIAMLEGHVDERQQAVKKYLSELGRSGLNEEDARRSLVIMDYAINLEHVGDIIEKIMMPKVLRKAAMEVRLLDDDHFDIRKLFEMTIDNLRIAQTAFAAHDFNLAQKMIANKDEIRAMERLSSERQMQRLRDGSSDHLATSSLHFDLLRDLRRVNGHIVSVAHTVIKNHSLPAILPQQRGARATRATR